MMRVPKSRGFTLVELMISVAIVGVLATMALPAFDKALLRAKAAERRTVMLRIKQAVNDYYLRNGTTLPPGYASPLDSGNNPPSAPSPAKRALATDLPRWNEYFSAPGGGSSLPAEIEGGVYYSYKFIVRETPAAGSITVIASGDLDGDGVISYKQIVFTRMTGTYQLTSESPPEGEEDEASPYATF
jgi:prepilin-type N-terminal cleavage/methylation domain-containing protein